VTSVKLRMAKGAAWMISLKVAIRTLGLISTVILARLLMPSDFGLVALGTAMIAVVELFSTFNFEVALIQNQEATRKHYDTAWTLNLMLAAASGLALAMLAAPTAAFYDEPRLANVIYCLAVGVVITGLSNIGVVEFRKDLEFHREFRFMLSKKIVSFVVVLPLAFVLRNYWALVAGILAGAIAGTTASYLMHPYRPRLSLSARRELVNFSKWLLLSNALYVLRHRSADFIIGRIAGARQLGVFALSYEISSLATTELAAPIDRAMLPGYAQMSSDRNVLRDGYFSVIGMIALLGVPAAVGIAATADLLVPVFLGQKWLDTIPVIQVLAIAGSISILASSAGSVCTAVGKPKYLIPLAGIHVIILLPLLFILVPRFGTLGAAWAYFCAAAVSLPVQLSIVVRILDARIGRLCSVVARPLIGACAMYWIVRSVMVPLHSPSGLFGQGVQLAAVVGIGIVAYVGIVFGLWTVFRRPAGAEATVVERIVNVFKGG
jgi:lipopolysaccharide exporter